MHNTQTLAHTCTPFAISSSFSLRIRRVCRSWLPARLHSCCLGVFNCYKLWDKLKLCNLQLQLQLSSNLKFLAWFCTISVCNLSAQSCWRYWKQLAANFAQNLPFFMFVCAVCAMGWEYFKTVCWILARQPDTLVSYATHPKHWLVHILSFCCWIESLSFHQRCCRKMQNKFLMNIEVWNLNWLHLICGFIAGYLHWGESCGLLRPPPAPIPKLANSI